MTRRSMPSIAALERAAGAVELDESVGAQVPMVLPADDSVVGVPEVASILDDLVGDDGLVEVMVLVSHDDLYAGRTVRLPPSERLVNLIISGWLEVPIG